MSSMILAAGLAASCPDLGYRGDHPAERRDTIHVNAPSESAMTAEVLDDAEYGLSSCCFGSLDVSWAALSIDSSE